MVMAFNTVLALNACSLLRSRRGRAGGAEQTVVRVSKTAQGKQLDRKEMQTHHDWWRSRPSRKDKELVIVRTRLRRKRDDARSGRTFSSNSSGVRRPSETVASLRVVPSL